METLSLIVISLQSPSRSECGKQTYEAIYVLHVVMKKLHESMCWLKPHGGFGVSMDLSQLWIGTFFSNAALLRLQRKLHACMHMHPKPKQKQKQVKSSKCFSCWQLCAHISCIVRNAQSSLWNKSIWDQNACNIQTEKPQPCNTPNSGLMQCTSFSGI